MSAHFSNNIYLKLIMLLFYKCYHAIGFLQLFKIIKPHFFEDENKSM